MGDASAVFWIGVGAICLGAGAFVSSIFQLARALRCRRWRPVEAEIVKTEIRAMSGGSSSVGGGSRKGSWLPVVAYRYVWEGREREGDRRVFGDFGASRERAERIVAQYRPGQRSTAWVNPHRPEMAVLDTRLTWGLGLPVLIAVAFIGCGVLALIKSGAWGG